MADLIVHAGDLVAPAVLEELQSLGEVIAVHGNVDDAQPQSALPASLTVEAGRTRIGVVHDAARPSAGGHLSTRWGLPG